MNNRHDGNPINILVFGTGAYACGRGTDGYGTIMPAVLEWKRDNRDGRVYVAGRSARSLAAAKRKIVALKRGMGADTPLDYINNFSARCAAKKVSRPCAAIVVVPDNAHKEVAVSAIKSGFHTLVVKPLAPTLDEARSLIKLQEKEGVYCAVEFHKRLDHANVMMRDAVRNGTIGDPLYFKVEYSQRKHVPSKLFRKWAAESNIFQYLGIHYVDIIYFVTGAAPVRAMAIGQKGWLIARGIDTYDAVEGVIEWKMPNGKKFISCILTNWIDPDNTTAVSDQKITAVGTKGRFESDQKKRGVTVVTDEKGVEEPNPYFCRAYGPDGGMEYRGYGIESVKQFLNDAAAIEAGALSVAGLEGRRPTFKETMVSTLVLDGINRSLKNNGRWIRINGEKR